MTQATVVNHIYIFVYISQNQPPGTWVTNVVAVDFDPPPNNKVTYYFLYNGQPSQQTGEFEIDPSTGVIITRQEFDRESRDTYQVNLRLVLSLFVV